MTLQQMTGVFLNYCQAKKLRPKTLASYEQAIKLFSRWLEEEKNIERVKDITEEHLLAYILDLQQRGKYTYCVNDATLMTNCPVHRRDYRHAVSNTTINNYMRNLKVFFAWMVEGEYEVCKCPICERYCRGKDVYVNNHPSVAVIDTDDLSF